MSNLKKPLTFEEQLEHLIIDKKLIVKNKENALNILKRDNYYRLSGYWKFFLRDDDTFIDGVCFESIYDVYKLDVKIRSSLFDVITSCEIYFKTQLAYYISMNYGALGYMDSNLFIDTDIHGNFIRQIENIKIANKNNPIVKTHNEKYDGKLPIWAVVELISFGSASKLFGNMRDKDKKLFCKQAYKNIRYPYLESFLHGVTLLRNRCCHFQRLYCWDVEVRPRMFIIDKSLNDFIAYNHSTFYLIYVLYLITPNIDLCSHLIVRLSNHFKHSNTYCSHYGFNKNWKKVLSQARGYCIKK